MTDRVDSYFKDYSAYHRTPGNRVCHYIGIPTLLLSIMGLLGTLPIAGGLTGSEMLRFDAAILLWMLAMVWHFYLDWKLAAPYALVTLGFYFVGRTIPVPILWALFVGGWIVQYVGHYQFEGKSPAFYKNGEHLLIGPFWVFAKLCGYSRQPSATLVSR